MEKLFGDILSIYAKICARRSDQSPLLHLIPMLVNDRLLDLFERDPDRSIYFKKLCDTIMRVYD